MFSSRTQKQSKSTTVMSDLQLAFWFPWRDSITPIESQKMSGKDKKTYNRRDSQMVTHSSTSRPVQCLCMAERTESFSITLKLESRFLESIPGSRLCSPDYISKSRGRMVFDSRNHTGLLRIS